MTHKTLPLLFVVAAFALNGCDRSPSDASAKPHADEKPHADAKGAAKDADHEKNALKLSDDEAQRAGIKLETVAPTLLADEVTVTATVHANQDRIARIAPRVEGRVVGVAAGLGSKVAAGQTLASLDSPAIGEAASAWLQAQSSQRVAEADFKRAEALDADEIIPRKELLRARAEYEKAGVALRVAEDKLRLLGVAPRRADAHAQATHVESIFPVAAPFAGVVVEKRAAVGQLATPSEPLFVVADLSKVWIEADLTEDLLSKVHVGAEARIKVPAYPDDRFSGRVTYVAALLDKDKRTVPARIEVDNRDGRLKPEMFVTAMIATGGADAKTKTQAITVPEQAIVLMQGVPSVFVLEHGSYEQRAVDPGATSRGRTVIKAGLAAGEQVVVAGTYALKARVLKSQIGDSH